MYPNHFSFGDKICNYVSSAIDISDGFYGDLNHLINDKNLGASIKTNLIPYSLKTRKLLNNRIISIDSLLSSGDDYELIFTANSKNSSIIKRISKKNNVKITMVGKIVKKKGIYMDDKKIKIVEKSFDHFA